jgi:hypothetical protein
MNQHLLADVLHTVAHLCGETELENETARYIDLLLRQADLSGWQTADLFDLAARINKCCPALRIEPLKRIVRSGRLTPMQLGSMCTWSNDSAFQELIMAKLSDELADTNRYNNKEVIDAVVAYANCALPWQRILHRRTFTVAELTHALSFAPEEVQELLARKIRTHPDSRTHV